MRRAKAQQAPEAYRQTTVSVGKSRDELDALLKKHQATGIAWQTMEVLEAGRYVAVARLRFRYEERVYRFEVVLGEKPQDQRQRMRALYWGLKAMLEQAEFGILRFEDVFMAYTELLTAEGRNQTVRELLGDQIASGQAPTLEGLPTVPMLPARIGRE